MQKLSLILRASLRSQLRWAGQHIYAWAILTPLVLGITYLSVSRVASNLSTAQLSFPVTFAVATGFATLLVALNLSGASAELFHIRRPEFYFEVLPVDTDTHLNAALASRLLRTTVVGLVVLSLKLVLQEPITWHTLLPLFLFIPLTALAEIFAALNWIHWGHTREVRYAVLALLALALIIVNAGWLLAAGVQSALLRYEVLLPLSVAAVTLLYLTTRRLHARWRSFDIEFARRLQSSQGIRLTGASSLWRRVPPAVASQLLRDLQLTMRGFSSAVYVVACVNAAVVVGLFALLTTGGWPPITDDYGWFDVMRAEHVSVVKIACALLTTAFATLVPVLIAYESPFLWLERAAGTSGLDMYQAKLTYARLTSLPAPLLAFLVGALSGAVPAYYLLPLLAECLLLWWAIASLTGALAFEMPTRPGLSIIMMLTLGVAGGIGASISLLTSAFLIVGVYFYAQSMHGLTDRGRSRAKYFLMFGDD